MTITILLYVAMAVALIMALMAMAEAGAMEGKSRRAAASRRRFGWVSAAMAVLLAYVVGNL